LKMNVQKDDKIAIISTNNRTEWNMDIGVWLVRNRSHLSNNFWRWLHILNHSGAIYCFVSDAEILRKINLIRDKIPNVKEVYSFNEIEV
jgi:long-chain acyl-CoA synthetase